MHFLILSLVLLSNVFALAESSHPQEEYRSSIRKKIIESSANPIPFSTIDSANEPRIMLPGKLIDDIRVIDRYQSRTLPRTDYLWSDDYWATYKGGLGFRYADQHFLNNTGIDWLKNLQLLLTPGKGTAEIIASMDLAQIAQLSPAEKYDLVMSDDNGYIVKDIRIDGSLNAYSWNGGTGPYDKFGKVEKWFGICHGWAPAAISVPRPLHSVTVPAANGINVPFTPSDIKGITSMLWANGEFKTHFIGRRCEDKEIPRDGSGRSTEKRCQDVNPGTWHLLTVNMIGLNKKTFIMDVNANYEVWNQPIVGYDFWYINPVTNLQTRDINQAMVPYYHYQQRDRFASYRQHPPAYIVNVGMTVRYLAESNPSVRPTDNERYDVVNQVTYYYDLEIDPYLRIFGGEWHSKEHPDFLWSAVPGTKLQSRYESYIGGPAINEDGSISEKAKKVSKDASSVGEPLGGVVDHLIRQSRK